VELTVVDHPLVAHKLTALRDTSTDSPTFRRLTEELVTLLAYEATRNVRTTPVTVQTPVASAIGVKLSTPRPLVVPILRAGLGMLEGMTRLMPTAEVGFVGLVRDEVTLHASTYAERLPSDLSGRQCYVLDPMLATGGTLAAAVQYLGPTRCRSHHLHLLDRGSGGHRSDDGGARRSPCALHPGTRRS